MVLGFGWLAIGWNWLAGWMEAGAGQLEQQLAGAGIGSTAGWQRYWLLLIGRLLVLVGWLLDCWIIGLLKHRRRWLDWLALDCWIGCWLLLLVSAAAPDGIAAAGKRCRR